MQPPVKKAARASHSDKYSQKFDSWTHLIAIKRDCPA